MWFYCIVTIQHNQQMMLISPATSMNTVPGQWISTNAGHTGQLPSPNLSAVNG
jgi:hypothetical protein